MPVSQRTELKNIFNSFYKNYFITVYFCPSKRSIMDFSAWWPFYVVIALFLLAIVSPWVFPNEKVSKNKHDNDF